MGKRKVALAGPRLEQRPVPLRFRGTVSRRGFGPRNLTPLGSEGWGLGGRGGLGAHWTFFKTRQGLFNVTRWGGRWGGRATPAPHPHARGRGPHITVQLPGPGHASGEARF